MSSLLWIGMVFNPMAWGPVAIANPTGPKFTALFYLP